MTPEEIEPAKQALDVLGSIYGLLMLNFMALMAILGIQLGKLS